MKRKPIVLSIYLGWFCLISLSVLKLFFPEAFALSISNPRILLIGAWFDAHIWAVQGFLFLTSYLTYFIYLCSCKQVWNLTTKEHIVLFSTVSFLCVVRFLSPDIGLTADTVAMILLPCIFKAGYTQFVTVFVLHYVGQILLLIIRSKSILLIGSDFASSVLISADAYLWLVIYYLYSNLYKEESLWEDFVHRFSATARRKRLKQNSQ